MGGQDGWGYLDRMTSEWLSLASCQSFFFFQGHTASILEEELRKPDSFKPLSSVTATTVSLSSVMSPVEPVTSSHLLCVTVCLGCQVRCLSIPTISAVGQSWTQSKQPTDGSLSYMLQQYDWGWNNTIVLYQYNSANDQSAPYTQTICLKQ